MHLRSARTSVAVAALLLLSACGKDVPDSGQSLLAYVPADTPYVYASLEPFDADLRKTWLTSMGGTQLFDVYKSMITEMGANLEREDGAEMIARVSAMMDLLRPISDPNERTPLGMAADAEVALYGYGLLPVMRVRLADAAAFEKVLSEMEKTSKSPMTTEEIGGYTVRRQQVDEIVFYVAAIEDQAVFALIPAAVDTTMREQVLGLSLPEQSLADSGSLQAAAKRYGFAPEAGVGIIDTVRLVEALADPSSAGDQALMALGSEADGEATTLDPVCLAEIKAAAALVPRMVSGSTSIDAQGMDSLSVIELPSEMAQAWSKVTAAQPGTRAPKDAWAWFGFGIDPVKMAAELGKMADKVAAAPYQCEHLSDLNTSMAEMKQGLNPMAVGMAANFTGLYVSVDKLEMDDSQMPISGEGVVALSSPAPAAVWALVKGQMDSLSAIDIGVDKGIVPVPDEMMPMPLPAKALMTDKSLALSVGPVDDERLTAIAEVDDSTPHSVVRYGISGEMYSEVYGNLMQEMTEKAAAQARIAEADALATGAEDAEELSKQREMAEEQARNAEHVGNLMRTFGAAIDYIDIRVLLTDNGIEMYQEVRLND